MAASKQRCQGKRRKQRGPVFGTFACGRNAKWVFQTYVGLTRTHYVCDDSDCMRSITSGYRAENVREL